MKKIYKHLKNRKTGNTVLFTAIMALSSSTIANDIVVDNSSDITTTANATSAIKETSATTDNINITNSGVLNTSGDDSDGIHASTQGSVSITNTGDINTTGNRSNAIYAIGQGAVSVNDTNHSSLSSSISGIYLKSSAGFNINSNSSININADNRSGSLYGIYSQYTGYPNTPTSNYNINYDGSSGSGITINVGNGTYESIFGIYALEPREIMLTNYEAKTNVIGNISLNTTNDTVMTKYLRGIYLDHRNYYSYLSYSNGTIAINANHQYIRNDSNPIMGIINYSALGNASTHLNSNASIVINDNSVTTMGHNTAPTAIMTYIASSSNPSSEKNVEVVNNGKIIIKSANNSARGIRVYEGNPSNSTLSQKQTMKIVNNGDIDISSKDALTYGIRMASYGESANGTITNNGNLRLNTSTDIGSASSAIVLQKTDTNSKASFTINNNGTITTTNGKAIEIDIADSVGTTVDINNSGILNGYVKSNTALEKLTINNSGFWNLEDTYGVSSGTIGEIITTLGSSTNYATVNNTGVMSVNSAMTDAIIDYANVSNRGIIDLGTDSAKTSLTINGNYAGDGGTIVMGTNLQKQISDLLSIIGDSIGSSYLSIHNTGGKGISTSNLTKGIKVVDVEGASSGSFALASNLKSGAYEYRLYKHADGNWYLTNLDGKGTDATGFSGGNSGKALINITTGGVFSNQQAALSMFSDSGSHAARGSAIRSANDKSVWGYYHFDKLNYDTLNGQMGTTIKSSEIVLGTDLYSTNLFNSGIYGSYGHASVNNKSHKTNSKTTGGVTGYGVGVYADWQQSVMDGGLSVESWAQYSWFKNNVKDKRESHKSRYDSSAFKLNFGTGYGFVLGGNDFANWILKPQAQLSYTWLSTDDFTDSSKIRYSDVDGDGAQIKLGARFYGAKTEANLGAYPYVEANWIYNSNEGSMKTGGQRIDSDMAKNLGEIKAGINGKITTNWNSFAEFDARFGKNDYHSVGLQIGINYLF